MGAAQVLNFFDAERDPPRRRSMTRMRIENRNTRHLPLPSGNIVEPGVSEITVYDDEVQAVEGLVEQGDEKFRLARQAYMAAVAREVKELLDWTGSVEELQALIVNKSDSRVNEAYERMLRESYLSFEGTFTDIFGRGPLPLVRAEVIESGMPEPQRLGLVEEQRRFVEVLREAGIGGNALSAEKLQQVIAEQVAAGVAAELKKHGIITRAEEPKPQVPPRK